MARSGKRVGIKWSLPGEYALGDAAEIAHRDKTTFQPQPSAFQQPDPGEGDSGVRLANPPHDSRSGYMKWSKHP